MPSLANFLFEVGMLAQVPRSGLAFLGSGRQSVAEHCFRMLHIAWLLARQSKEPLDELHLLHLVMFHDLPETRTGDFNWVHHKYDRVNEKKLLGDLAAELPFGQETIALIREFEAATTPEARLANDADQLEFLFTLKEQLDLGNKRAADWMTPAFARLKTDVARELAGEAIDTPSDDWWFHNKTDRHWIDRGRGTDQ